MTTGLKVYIKTKIIFTQLLNINSVTKFSFMTYLRQKVKFSLCNVRIFLPVEVGYEVASKLHCKGGGQQGKKMVLLGLVVKDLGLFTSV